jgi:hypothetical protein
LNEVESGCIGPLHVIQKEYHRIPVGEDLLLNFSREKEKGERRKGEKEKRRKGEKEKRRKGEKEKRRKEKRKKG